MTYFVLTVGTGAAALLSMAFVTRRPAAGRTPLLAGGAALSAGLLAAVVARLFEAPIGDDQQPVLLLFAAVLAVCGGSLATTAVFELVDGHGAVQAAESVLRGGAWIGALERLAVFGSLVSGLPEGVAVVLAVKALGRYPELRFESSRTRDQSGAGERFIIGTMVSMLWAAGAAVLALG